jgi:hypothetical protein
VRTDACPPAPTGLVATPSRNSVALHWTAPAAGLTYRVLVNGRLIRAVSGTTSSVGSLHCAVTRTFQVESVDASGSVSALAAVDATTLAC